MRIVFDIAGIMTVYFLGYLIGFRSGIRSIMDELNKATREFMKKNDKLRKDNNVVKECE